MSMIRAGQFAYTRMPAQTNINISNRTTIIGGGYGGSCFGGGYNCGYGGGFGMSGLNKWGNAGLFMGGAGNLMGGIADIIGMFRGNNVSFQGGNCYGGFGGGFGGFGGFGMSPWGGGMMAFPGMVNGYGGQQKTPEELLADGVKRGRTDQYIENLTKTYSLSDGDLKLNDKGDISYKGKTFENNKAGKEALEGELTKTANSPATIKANKKDEIKEFLDGEKPDKGDKAGLALHNKFQCVPKGDGFEIRISQADGTRKTVQAATREDVEAFYTQHMEGKDITKAAPPAAVIEAGTASSTVVTKQSTTTVVNNTTSETVNTTKDTPKPGIVSADAKQQLDKLGYSVHETRAEGGVESKDGFPLLLTRTGENVKIKTAAELEEFLKNAKPVQEKATAASTAEITQPNEKPNIAQKSDQQTVEERIHFFARRGLV